VSWKIALFPKSHQYFLKPSLMEVSTFWRALIRCAVTHGTNGPSSASPRHSRVTLVSSCSVWSRWGYSLSVDTLTIDAYVDALNSFIRPLKHVSVLFPSSLSESLPPCSSAYRYFCSLTSLSYFVNTIMTGIFKMPGKLEELLITSLLQSQPFARGLYT